MDELRPRVLSELEDDALAPAAEAFTRIAVDYFAATRTGEGPVSTPLGAAELARRFDEPLPVDGRPLEEVVERLRGDVVADSNRLCHPRSMGHQVSAPLPAAVWTESLIAALNQSGAVQEMSPVGTAVENRIVRWMCDLAGFGPRAGGTFTSGGTEATFTALLAARAASLPNAWKEGVGAEPPVVLHGEHAHYAVARAVGALGLGTDAAIAIPSDGWRMDVSALEAALRRQEERGRRVMAVVATAGSTATGSFDDLDAIGRLCEERGLWLHVDGAHGASALLSSTHRGRLRGIERARSLAWDPHKMMLMPLSAGVVLVRDERDLDAAFTQRAPYLFHGAEGERSPDQGKRSFQCSRRLDALKVWVALQRYGAGGIGVLYDHLCATARALHSAIGRREAFEALHEPEANILCFRYVGDRSLDPERLDALNLRLRELFNRSGEGWITTTVLGGKRVLRVTVMNPRTTGTDVERVLDGLEATGGQLAEGVRRDAGQATGRPPP
ncbi:MAG: aminotransferase class V-fold PLP-dependent enzyme [Holophagales bacterium]|nr:aminotransferase class V-fold PLP-dependent enzyme [Holophagales bacterium]